MKSLKKYQAPIIMIAIAAIVFGLFWLLQKPKMILFFSNSCPHCKIVEQYISDNNIDAKIKFQKLEVSQDPANAALLEKKARQCGLDVSQGLGVPLFFDGSKCLLGDKDITDYFKKL